MTSSLTSSTSFFETYRRKVAVAFMMNFASGQGIRYAGKYATEHLSSYSKTCSKAIDVLSYGFFVNFSLRTGVYLGRMLEHLTQKRLKKILKKSRMLSEDQVDILLQVIKI